jgi:hypothetical protein
VAFAGTGPYYLQMPNDTYNSDATYDNPSNPNADTATPPGGRGTVFSVGSYADTNATYGYISDYFGNQGRTYGIGVDVAINEVIYDGLQNASLGNATLSVQSNQLIVGNLGTNGQDGGKQFHRAVL